MKEMEENELIKACIKNDRTAYTQLFNRYAPKMLMVCSRYMSDEDEAKDVLQNGFIKVFKSLKSFKFKGSFEGWLKRIMVNEALGALRQKKKLIFDNNSFHENMEVAEENEELPAYDFTQEELLHALKTLPEAYKAVFNLYCFEKYSHKEIASVLSIKIETSRSRLLRARKLLKEQLFDLATQKSKLNENG
ncbi:RNA polymerase sigma factor [Rapidithrix thailandica]|uniref:RNA polymerase sigma factor n=1 Tax=Rapidithrix thailandica TaxID=413964 RepID=A0AAW9S5R7_9BACT